ncbi:hypothetical protein BHE74_00047166 [Ensete ventricosum]|nr:hypothetical protein GW17_00010742 [Ensete ventricosum]RWW46883.1 hypothetical protein BHE74_00047166 [Ensete ventricosum]RZS20073.1 hypothetical protein BHM03_00052542 [Ensete ventricosum]
MTRSPTRNFPHQTRYQSAKLPLLNSTTTLFKIRSLQFYYQRETQERPIRPERGRKGKQRSATQLENVSTTTTRAYKEEESKQAQEEKRKKKLPNSLTKGRSKSLRDITWGVTSSARQGEIGREVGNSMRHATRLLPRTSARKEEREKRGESTKGERSECK